MPPVKETELQGIEYTELQGIEYFVAVIEGTRSESSARVEGKVNVEEKKTS